jgi:hypothetical protein
MGAIVLLKLINPDINSSSGVNPERVVNENLVPLFDKYGENHKLIDSKLAELDEKVFCSVDG